jgi:hypothetical protein
MDARDISALIVCALFGTPLSKVFVLYQSLIENARAQGLHRL